MVKLFLAHKQTKILKNEKNETKSIQHCPRRHMSNRIVMHTFNARTHAMTDNKLLRTKMIKQKKKMKKMNTQY